MPSRRAAEARMSNATKKTISTTSSSSSSSSSSSGEQPIDDSLRVQQVRRPLEAAASLVELFGATALTTEQQRYLSLLREAIDAMRTAVGPEPSARPLEGANIVVIDDVASNRMYASEVLQRAGAQVYSCADAEQALLLLAQQPMSLVVLDLEMPGVGGLEFLRRLRAQPAPLDRLPVLVLSAADEREVAAAVTAASATFLAKPASIHDIVAFAADALGAPTTLAPATYDGASTDAAALADEAAFATAVASNDRRRLAILIGTVRLTDARLAAALDDALGRGDFDALMLRLRRRRQPVTASFTVAPTFQRTFVDSLLVEEQRLRDVRAGNNEVVRAIAHRIAGSAATFGAPELGLMARHICQVLAAASDVDLQGLATTLADGIADLRANTRREPTNGKGVRHGA
jgi:CheY-like chemotaxis protein